MNFIIKKEREGLNFIVQDFLGITVVVGIGLDGCLRS
jgi:hypothetical protein